MRNELAFQVSQEVAPSDPVSLGKFLASPYDKIRVLAYCPFDAQGDVELSLIHIEGEGAPGHLDRFILVPGSNVNKVYAVPGVILGVAAQTTADATTSVTVWVWGHRTDGGTQPMQTMPPEPPPAEENSPDQ